MLLHIIYICCLFLLVLSLPSTAFSDARGTLILLGTIGIWRYSWALVNFLRACFYCRYAYPRLRSRAEAAYLSRKTPPHAFFLITSYKIAPFITCRVYRATFLAAQAAPGGATIVASVVEPADARLIQCLFDNRADQTGQARSVRLIVDQIPGTGKRDALARGFRLIARQAPSARDIVAVIDGDSIVPLDLVRRCAPFFCDPMVGALTTDEVAEPRSGWLFRDWFALRFAQRQVLMCSMAVGRRVLTLTGRLSVFRASLACEAGFIRMVQADHVDHWRYGRVRFLTGDDKSTWFYLLQSGHHMLYLPDLCSTSLETQPEPGFLTSAGSLMTRWFGNMLRTNGRALGLAPGRIGWFTWWSLLDQRVSIWTTLAGPTAVVLVALFLNPIILLVYLVWVMFTRYLFCLALSLFRGGRFRASFPLLLYFSQVTGAAIKSFVLFRLNRQRWTRQQTSPPRKPTKVWSSAYLHGLSLGWLLLAVLHLSGLV